MAKKLAFDGVLFTTVVALTVFGLVMVHSASTAVARESSLGVNPYLVKQGIAAGLGLMMMGITMHLDYKQLRRPAVIYGLLGGVLVLLVAVLFAPALNNTHRWFVVGGFSFQPSELAKLAIVPFLAYQIDRKWERINSPVFLIPCGVVLCTVAGLVFAGPDLGTTVLILAASGVLLFLGGLSLGYLGLATVVALPAIAALVIAAPYRAQRWMTFLNPEQDPTGAGFQINQSLIAVGSGGVTGLGLGGSLQKLHFLPHPHSDFIYSIVSEELGLIGALALLAGFALFLARGILAGRHAPDRFGAFLAWGLTATIGIQALTHISVAVALLPTTGVPLPFVSYGGSSMVTTLTACGVLLNVSQHG
jgi:cell division protein FtsW